MLKVLILEVTLGAVTAGACPDRWLRGPILGWRDAPVPRHHGRAWDGGVRNRSPAPESRHGMPKSWVLLPGPCKQAAGFWLVLGMYLYLERS